ncbi:MAG: queuine tRNA-ribosyltransferase [Chloroflexota bacterium]|jgi:queuine tRNA-ribosyltransferase|nr:queuine tRNA-ribosyltransferase [Chloroflexota bacterium]
MSGRFDILAESSGARAGVLETAHGPIETPAFMPVGTQGTVKGLTPADVRSLGAQCILGNTYHLWLRPGEDVIERAGGLHHFIGWDRAILTDSGGFQILSLAHLAEIDEGGARFQSHLDDSQRTLTPERAMAIQAALGSDIAMVLDVCPPHDATLETVRLANERTTRWAYRSLAAPHAAGQLVFAIVQGGVNPALRQQSASELAEGAFDGFGIGGLSVGEARADTWTALEAAVAPLPASRPRYLMGVGAPDDVLGAIARGVDMFDCVLPTRLGRNGAIFTPRGRLSLRSASLASMSGPLDPACDCAACTRFAAGYIHHLVRAGEELGFRLASIHNLRYLARLVGQAREAIIAGRFVEFAATALAGWQRPDDAAAQRNRERYARDRGRTSPEPT